MFVHHLSCSMAFYSSVTKAMYFHPYDTAVSALLTTPKPLTAWIITNCGKFWKRWEYQTTWSASWEICMQVRKQQENWTWNNRLVPNRERSTSRLYKEIFFSLLICGGRGSILHSRAGVSKLSVKGWIANSLNFACQTVSVTTTQFWHRCTKAAKDNT